MLSQMAEKIDRLGRVLQAIQSQPRRYAPVHGTRRPLGGAITESRQLTD